jgi:hypothetical protein
LSGQERMMPRDREREREEEKEKRKEGLDKWVPSK